MRMAWAAVGGQKCSKKWEFAKSYVKTLPKSLHIASCAVISLYFVYPQQCVKYLAAWISA